MTTCATCGIDLTPVSLYTAVIVTDMTEGGEAVTLLFGRACGDAAALLNAPTTSSHRRKTGRNAPVHDGRDARPVNPGRRPVVDPAVDASIDATPVDPPVEPPKRPDPPRPRTTNR